MAPRFWTRPPGPVLRLVGPLAPGIRIAKRRALEPPLPVIAVGSLSLGGTGKTPAVIALTQRLIGRGRAVHVVTRGTGAAVHVDPRVDDAGDVGDDALLIAAFGPTWVAADPAEGVRAAAAGAEAVVLDGGWPDAGVAPTRTIVVEDAARGFGNGYAWPLGPLKRRFRDAFGGVDLVLAIGPRAAQEAFSRRWGLRVPCPTLGARLEPLQTGMDWAGLDVIAFAGIGAPERFFATLTGLGANLIRAQALSDHQEMTPTLLGRLEAEARRSGAQLVTTEKDAVRLPPEFRPKVISLPVRLEPADWAPLDRLLP